MTVADKTSVVIEIHHTYIRLVPDLVTTSFAFSLQSNAPRSTLSQLPIYLQARAPASLRIAVRDEHALSNITLSTKIKMINLETCVALLATLFCVFIAFFKWRYSYWRRKGLPFLAPKIPFGNTENPLTRDRNMAFVVKSLYEEVKGRGLEHAGTVVSVVYNKLVSINYTVSSIQEFTSSPNQCIFRSIRNLLKTFWPKISNISRTEACTSTKRPTLWVRTFSASRGPSGKTFVPNSPRLSRPEKWKWCLVLYWNVEMLSRKQWTLTAKRESLWISRRCLVVLRRTL